MNIKKGATSHSICDLRIANSEVVKSRAFAVMVETEPGVPARVIRLFSERGFNTDSKALAALIHSSGLSDNARSGIAAASHGA